MIKGFKIVRKSNFDAELFTEVFIEPLEFRTREAASAVCQTINDYLATELGEYIFEVEQSDYKLYDGYKELL